MQFTSFEFAVFFPLVVVCFYIMPKKARPVWLLLASYYFYMGWNPKYAVLILASTIITYICARVLECFERKQKLPRRMVLLAGLISNLAILVF
ncbi:MAG: MBOAT family protein, partial [Lachnospiraceae bacterium]|nr:MBOAT family protein [Lachnospiraceae bacterium]